MAKRLRSQLTKLQSWLEEGAQFQKLIQELLAETEEVHLLNKVQPLVTEEKVETLLTELRQLTREQAKKQLESMKKKEIEPLFRQLGGKSSEAKTKEYVIGRILWHLFDFPKEQDILLSPFKV